MESILSDAAAAARARQGDASAYAVLVQGHQAAAFRTAYLILRDAPAAEDVAQEAFIRAYRGLSGFREGEAFRPWLLRIVTNLALNEVRSRGRKQGLLQRIAGLLPREEAPAADVPLAQGETAASVNQAMGRLKQGDRLVLHLRYFIGLDEREMARVLGSPPGTVKSRLHRAGRRLREIIERDYPQLRDSDD